MNKPGSRKLLAQEHWQRLEVETPEQVVIDYELAGFGTRLLAGLIDLTILGLATLLVTLTGSWLAGRSGVGTAVVLIVIVGLFWGYFALFEGLYRGQTPGKKWMGIRVVRDTGHPIGMADATLRNLLRAADALPPPFLLGLLLIAFHPRAKRLGDLIAGTVVVRDRPAELPSRQAAAVTSGLAVEAVGAPLLTDAEFQVLEQFLNRTGALEPEVTARFADRLVGRFAERIPAGQRGIVALQRLFAEELERRRGRFGSRHGTTGPGERFLAQKTERWAAFELMATRASSEGLDTFAPDQLIEFTSRYREVAADLARARTYGVPAAMLHRIERGVAAGHNALYRREEHTWRRLGHFVLVECPAAVLEARWTVALAFAAFAVPAGLGYGLLRDQPTVAPEVLPEVMLDRARQGVERQRKGKGYFDADADARPLMAASIIANNVQVAFFCFAGGAFAGVGSLFLLATNGLSIGAATGHFANNGLFAYLWTFIAGHGLLELFAIWVAGAAGFQLGLAMIAPGRRSRRDALVVAGRIAIRMVGFAVVLLLIAGLVEGLISASTVPASAKFAVSAASAVLLVAYLSSGLRRPTAPAR